MEHRKNVGDSAKLLVTPAGGETGECKRRRSYSLETNMPLDATTVRAAPPRPPINRMPPGGGGNPVAASVAISGALKHYQPKQQQLQQGNHEEAGDSEPLLLKQLSPKRFYRGSQASGSDDTSSIRSLASSRASSFVMRHGLFRNLHLSLLPSDREVVVSSNTYVSSGSSCDADDELGGHHGIHADEDYEEEEDKDNGNEAQGYDYDDFMSSASSEDSTASSCAPEGGVFNYSTFPAQRRESTKKMEMTKPSRGKTKTREANIAIKNNRSLSSEPNNMHYLHGGGDDRTKRVRRGLRRRIFLLLTDPTSSISSAAFFIVLILMIAASNIVMMMQTMDKYNFTPERCDFCDSGGTYPLIWADDNIGDDAVSAMHLCECPPQPVPAIVFMADGLIYIFTVEWSLRVICYAPPVGEAQAGWRFYFQWLAYLTDSTVVMDALAIFPYYLERFEQTNGLVSLRLVRLFRVFQLLRLGQYNNTFTTLWNVIVQSMLSLNVLLIVLVFGAAFFGSMIYWLEKGEWKYTDYTDPPSFKFMRIAADGLTEEPSPFVSIPMSFWWFIVTATTVGYGDVYPTTVNGKIVATAAMIMGLLVIAFPVSIFSDLWSKELKKSGALSRRDSSDDLSYVGEKVLHSKSPYVAENVLQGMSEKISQRSLLRGLTPSPQGNLGEIDNSVAVGSARRWAKSNAGLMETSECEKSVEPQGHNPCEASGSNLSPVPPGIMLTRSDVEAIKRHLDNIDESQRQIRLMLNRFCLSSDDGS